MARLKREVTKKVQENVIICDFVCYSEDKSRVIPCKEEEILEPIQDEPPGWVGVEIARFKDGLLSNNKYIHFCPEHVKELDTRLARVLEP